MFSKDLSIFFISIACLATPLRCALAQFASGVLLSLCCTVLPFIAKVVCFRSRK